MSDRHEPTTEVADDPTAAPGAPGTTGAGPSDDGTLGAATDPVDLAAAGPAPATGGAPDDATGSHDVPADGAADLATASPDEVVDDRTPEELLVALHAAEIQREEYLDDLRRARAEFENFRKRTTREAAAARDAGRGDVATALFDVLDDLDRTVEAADGSSDETLAKGVTLVADKLARTLEGQGIVRIGEAGEVFDPSVHDAVQQVPADPPVEAPVVATVLRPGYRLGDRVLRPAMVVVAG